MSRWNVTITPGASTIGEEGGAPRSLIILFHCLCSVFVQSVLSLKPYRTVFSFRSSAIHRTYVVTRAIWKNRFCKILKNLIVLIILKVYLKKKNFILYAPLAITVESRLPVSRGVIDLWKIIARYVFRGSDFVAATQ